MSEIFYWIMGAWWAAASLIYLGTLLMPAFRSRRRPAGGAVPLPPVSILVPMKGLEPELPDNLRSLLRQSYPTFEVLFAVAEPDDPAIPLVRAAMAEHPATSAHLLIGGGPATGNPKVNNLAIGERAARHPLLLLCDANIALPPDALARLVRELAPDIGLLSAIPLAARPANFVGELECAMFNGHAARWLIAADRVGIAVGVGKVMLLRRRTLDRVGGIPVLAGGLCEDAVLAESIGALGLRVVMARDPILHPVGARRLRDFWERHLRWQCCHRCHHRFTFPLEPCTGAVAATLAGAFFLSHMAAASALTAIVLMVAGWFSAEALYLACQGWPMSWRSPAAWVVREFLLPVLWLQAAMARSLVWRGNRLDVRVS